MMGEGGRGDGFMMIMNSAAALDCERWLEAKEFEEHSKK